MVKYGFVAVSCLFKNVLAIFHPSEILYTYSGCTNDRNIIDIKRNRRGALGFRTNDGEKE